MKPKHSYGAVAVWCVMFFAFAPSLCAQEATAPGHEGVPLDWSQHHIVFSRNALAQHPDLMYREPRVLHQVMERWQPPNWGVFQDADPQLVSTKRSGPKRDWNFSLGSGRLGPHVFPAKFSFDPASPPDCVNDYVVFGMSIPGTTGGQANLVAFNNLYVDSSGLGICPGTAPNVMFAYNITTAGGKIVTSPILSLDGKKIGFVESVPGATPSAIFHVLTWTAGQGTITAAAAPPASPAFTSTIFSPVANSTSSSPWIDFGNDIVYLGADNGNVYKITGVFKGTPTLSGFPWPVLTGTNVRLSPPVLDSILGLLMVGGSNGDLYQIDTATATVVATLPVGSGGTSSGVYAPPIVDITNGTTFVVSANAGASLGVGAVLVEADTATLGTVPPLAVAQIGVGSSGGTALRLYEPAFSNDYFNNPSTGIITLCGTGTTTGDTSPWQYAFGFTGNTINTASPFSRQLITSTAAHCTGWTEFFNPNLGLPIGTDFFFFGLSQDCTTPGGGIPAGCVAEISGGSGTALPLFVTVPGGSSGIVVDNYSLGLGASSIYLSAEGFDTAYKFTQNGLN